jgi:hypothetical protein
MNGVKGGKMMVRLLLAIGIGEIIVGLLVGFVAGNQDGFHLFTALGWWVGGFVSGVAFIALALIFETLERVESNLFTLLQAYKRSNPTEPVTTKSLGNSRSSLSKLSSYRMGKLDQEE